MSNSSDDLFTPIGQGLGEVVEDGTIEAERELDSKFTHPNLHRRIDPQQPTSPDEKFTRSYEFGIYGFNSHRIVTKNTHIEEPIDYDSVDDPTYYEIP